MFDLYLTLTEASCAEQEVEAAAIERAQRDPMEFSAIYRQFVDRVFYYVLAKADSRGDAEDITAQVFLDALESLPRYRHRGHFAAWLFTIARHRLADFYRQNRAERLNADPGRRPGLRPSPTGPATTGSAPTEGVDPLGEIIEVEHLERLSKLVAELKEDERELLRLRFAAGLNFAEIAALQGRKESAIKMSTYRLLARLNSQMEAGHA